MDGENDGKPNEQMDDLGGGGGGETTIFENTHICSDVFFSFFFRISTTHLGLRQDVVLLSSLLERQEMVTSKLERQERLSPRDMMIKPMKLLIGFIGILYWLIVIKIFVYNWV